MPPFPMWIALLLLLVLLVATLGTLAAYRRRLHHVLGRDRGDPIPTVALADFDPRFRSGPYGPTHDAEVRFIGTGDGVPHGTTDREAWVLAVLARGARRMFEFGTATGKTAWLWAVNSPPDARVTTLTLAPGQAVEYHEEAADTGAETRRALEESAFTDFLYSGTEVERKIEQLFGDSKALDETPWVGSMDLVFIDGSHAYSYVRSDTEKALRMLAPGGVVLWHDYRSPSGRKNDVYRYLNDLARERELVRLAGTNLVAHRAPDPS